MGNMTNSSSSNSKSWLSIWTVYDYVVVAAFVLGGLLIFARHAHQMLTVDPFSDYLEMAVILMGMTVGMMVVQLGFILSDVERLEIGEGENDE